MDKESVAWIPDVQRISNGDGISYDGLVSWTDRISMQIWTVGVGATKTPISAPQIRTAFKEL